MFSIVSRFLRNNKLTTGVDRAIAATFVGSLSSYNFDGHGPTLTGGDTLTGSQTGAGANNTLALSDGYNQGVDIMPSGIYLNNIQTVSLQTAGNAGVSGNPFNTAPYSSVTNTTVSSSGGGSDSVQASATGAISVTHNSNLGGVTVIPPLLRGAHK